MAVLQSLLRRWGFVKLRSYGLQLTADGRILSTRPAVLNDGTGGRIVGWRDGDVSIWKLSDWQVEPEDVSAPTRRANAPDRAERDAPPVASAPAAAPTPVAVPEPAAAPLPAVAPLPAAALPAAAVSAEPVAFPPFIEPAPTPPSAAVMPVEVAAEPAVDEDDWEWTIALARARAAVEETELAVPPPPVSRPKPAATVRAEPAPAPRPPERPTPQRTTGVRDAAASGEWPKTDLSGSIDYDDYFRAPTRPSMPVPRSESRTEPLPAVSIPRTATPSTVIPVPTLPSMATMTAGCTRMEPVVRTQQSSSASAAASRLAKGTGPVDPPATQRLPAVLVDDTIPDLSVGDRTRPGVAMPRQADVAASSGDRTKPGIALPPAGRTVELPSIKRRMQPR